MKIIYLSVLFMALNIIFFPSSGYTMLHQKGRILAPLKVIPKPIAAEDESPMQIDEEFMSEKYFEFKLGNNAKKERREMFIQTHHLEDVSEYVNHLINQEEVKPNEIAVVIDLDGTLTTQKLPCMSPISQERLATPHAREMVRDFKKRQIHVIVSSAWTDFRKTLSSIEELELQSPLEVPKPEVFDESPTHAISMETLQIRDKKIQYFKNGHVISLRNTRSDSELELDPYFRQKAFSLFVVLNRGELEALKHVILVDDSYTNIHLFQRDIQEIPIGADEPLVNHLDHVAYFYFN